MNPVSVAQVPPDPMQIVAKPEFTYHFPDDVLRIIFSNVSDAKTHKAINLACRQFHKVSPISELVKLLPFLIYGNVPYIPPPNALSFSIKEQINQLNCIPLPPCPTAEGEILLRLAPLMDFPYCRYQCSVSEAESAELKETFKKLIPFFLFNKQLQPYGNVLENSLHYINGSSFLLPDRLHYATSLDKPFFARQIRHILENYGLWQHFPGETPQEKVRNYVDGLIRAVIGNTKKPATPDMKVMLADSLWHAAGFRIAFHPWMEPPHSQFSWVRQHKMLNSIANQKSVQEGQLQDVDQCLKVLFEKTVLKKQCQESDPAITPLVEALQTCEPKLFVKYSNIMRLFGYIISGGNDAELLILFPELVKDNKRLVQKAARMDGLTVQFASDRLKNDFDVGLSAVQQNGSAYEFLSEKLKTDPKIILAALAQRQNIVTLIPEEARQNPECALTIKQIQKDLEKPIVQQPIVGRDFLNNLRSSPGTTSPLATNRSA